MLGIEPLELHFPFEINKQMSCSLQLTNKTDSYIAFNVENKSCLPYCTQPHKGIVPPRSKCIVATTLLLQDMALPDIHRAKKFIVWSTKVNDDLAADDITTNMFDKEMGSVVDDVHLDVVFDLHPLEPNKLAGAHDLLERMLQDSDAKPIFITLELLKDVTGDFSVDREVGRGAYGVVYKVIPIIFTSLFKC
jgi:hypothetical protein